MDAGAGGHRRRLALGALSVLLVVCALGATTARSQDLESVRAREARVAGQIAQANREINDLLGEVTSLRAREAQAAAELAAEQRELDRASAELGSGRERLREARAELKVAIRRLERLLVEIYKSDEPDALSLVLGASTFEQMVEEAEFIEELNDYQSATIGRVRELRAELDTLVAELASERERIEAARDRAAERHGEIATARAAVESRQAALAAARAERRQILSSLRREESDLLERLTVTPATTDPAAPEPAPAPPPNPGQTATIGSDGKAIPPAGAPPAVVAAIEAANRISNKPYQWGGGHGSFESAGYDCSGAVSYALHGGGWLSAPLDSTGLSFWGEPGAGEWITVYANSGHAYAVIAGLRWDTSGTGGSGPRWQADAYARSGFVARHPSGY